jgi:acyl-coenzyme A synthetase/AMP-(fatty) acid ligase
LKSLWRSLVDSGGEIAGGFCGPERTVNFAELKAGSMFPMPVEELRGRSLLIATGEQLATALALLELDGVARRMVLCTPDLTGRQLEAVAAAAQADAVVGEAPHPEFSALPRIAPRAKPTAPIDRPHSEATDSEATDSEATDSEATEWVLLTSGTTGTPKLVVHSLRSLCGALSGGAAGASRSVWSTFYDIRRYGGLQIYLRAVRSGSLLVLSSGRESIRDFLARASRAGVTHISGTPSHWRRALMSGAARLISPAYVRLSGEVADQSILDGLKEAFPGATIAHAFASTEAGVGFDVTDGLAGFPETFVDRPGRAADRDRGVEPAPADLKVADGTLRIRSRGIGARYLGGEARSLADDEGYIDTGDLVELVGDRYYFRGRRGGVINVGGYKVYPEEVEAVLNADPRVRMSLVRGRRNPIMGAVAVADVVLTEGAPESQDPVSAARLKDELLNACRRVLPAYKVPAVLRLVAKLDVTEAGKLVRPDA